MSLVMKLHSRALLLVDSNQNAARATYLEGHLKHMNEQPANLQGKTFKLLTNQEKCKMAVNDDTNEALEQPKTLQAVSNRGGPPRTGW